MLFKNYFFLLLYWFFVEIVKEFLLVMFLFYDLISIVLNFLVINFFYKEFFLLIIIYEIFKGWISGKK